MGAGGAGRFSDSKCERLGRESNCDGSGANYGKILATIWSEGARGIFVGRDGGEGAATGGCDRGGNRDGIIIACESAARGGYGAGVGDGVHHESRSCRGRRKA